MSDTPEALAEGFEAKWISAETWQKECHFRGILEMHIRIVKGISSRWPIPPYLYADLHAGPGYLKDPRRGSYNGSPLIFLDQSSHLERFEALFFEKQPEVADQLRRSVWHAAATLHRRLQPTVFAECCEDAMARWLRRTGRNVRRYGLIYSDPIGKRIPVELLQQAAVALPRTDILCYPSATAYKREGKYRLADDIDAIGKRYALIREPQGPWQWTFILLTNWAEFPAWEKAGFYRVDTGRGQEILSQLNLTSREFHAQRNAELPFAFPPTAPTPSTSGTRSSAPSERRSSSGQAGSANGASNGQRPNPITLPIPRGGTSTFPRTSSPSATSATAEHTGRSGEDD